MGGEHDGDAVGAHLLQQLPRRTSGGGVHPGGRLVDEDQLRATHHRHRQLESLLLTTGESSVGGAATVAEPEPLTQDVHVEGLGVQPGDVAHHLHGTHARPGATVLEHHPDPGEQVPSLPLGVQPQDRDRSLLRSAVALAGLQRGGLAGAVRTEHRGDRVPVDGQVEVVHGQLVAVAHHQAPDRDRRSRHVGGRAGGEHVRILRSDRVGRVGRLSRCDSAVPSRSRPGRGAPGSRP